MDSLLANEAFQSYALCSAILAFKMLFSATYTGICRNRSAGYINSEDAVVFGGGVSALPQEHESVAHALRIQRNDGENIPLFFAIGLIYVLSGASAGGALAYAWTFTIARILHTIFYMRQMQPWRALAFGAGALCIIGMSVQIAMAAL